MDLRTAQNIAERKTDEVVMSKMSPDNQEKTIASKTYNAEGEKNHIPSPPDSKPLHENNPESLGPESRSSQIKVMTVEGRPKADEEKGAKVEVITKEKPAMSAEDQPKAGEAKGAEVGVITKEKPVMSASNSGVKEFSDTVEPARIASRAAKNENEAGRDLSARDNVLLEEKPVAPQPFQQQSVSVETPVERISTMPSLQEETGRAVVEPEVKSSEVKEEASQVRLEKDKDKQIEREEKLEAKYEPPVPNPFQKTIHNKELKKKALSGKKGQGQGKLAKNKKSAIKGAGSQGNTGAGKEAKSQDRDEKRRNTAMAKAAGTPMEIPGGGISTPVSSQQLTPGGMAPAHPSSVGADTKGTESEMKAALAQQREDSIHREKVDKRETAQPDRGEAGLKDEKFGFGFPKVEALQLGDIKVEVNLDGKETQSVSMHLSKKPYPSTSQRVYKSKQEDVKCAAETKEEDLGASGIRHFFSILKADHGIYTFTIDNKGNEIHVAAIVFRLYEGQGRERIKEYKNVQIQPGAVSRFKFIVPDAIFWDDKDRFSGEIESSKSITKFNGSGLVWIEDKE